MKGEPLPEVELPKPPATQQEISAATSDALKRGDWAAVAALQEQLLALDNLSPEVDQYARVMLGNALIVQGKPAEARKVLEEFIAKEYSALSPEQNASLRQLKQSSQLTLAVAYAQAKDNVKAREVLQSLLEMEDVDPQLVEAAKKMLKAIKPEFEGHNT